MNGVLGTFSTYPWSILHVLLKSAETFKHFVTGMLKMLMDTDLDAKQMDYAQTAHGSGKDLTSLINEVLDQAKIESGRLELENVPFDMRFILDNVSSLLSGKANEKGIEV
jgi:histidine kinase 2/3/4 (cytokinin receptor)